MTYVDGRLCALPGHQAEPGGKVRLGGISKRGDGYLRRLLMTGATAALRRSKSIACDPWVQSLLKRKPRKVVATALANKMARTAWALLQKGGSYQPATI